MKRGEMDLTGKGQAMEDYGNGKLHHRGAIQGGEIKRGILRLNKTIPSCPQTILPQKPVKTNYHYDHKANVLAWISTGATTGKLEGVDER
jgi:hypothetical protein